MTSAKQIESNRQNAQSSTGPTTEAGKQRSSLNSTRHGFTGQTLVLSTSEKEAYEFHCLSYMEQFAPATHEETELTQQYCDLTWSLHQIFVQQSNLLTVVNSVTTNLMKAGDLESISAAIAPINRSLNTLSTYESRKRRAAADVLQRLTALKEARKVAVKAAAPLYKANKTHGKPWNPTDFGFVCTEAEIETHLRRENAFQDLHKRPVE